MEINFLGKGSAFCPLFGSTSASFVIGKRLFVLDCGETVFESLFRSGILEQVDEVYILITHLHSDHVGSLGSLISYSYCIQKRVINIVHPNSAIVKLLCLLGIKDEFYRYHPQFPNIAELDFSLEATPVGHVDNMACFGYTLSYNGKSIYYSGDANDIPEGVLQDFLQGKITTLYHDAATVHTPGHCHYTKLAEKIPAEHRHRVVCMHLDGESQDILLAQGFLVAATAQ